MTREPAYPAERRRACDPVFPLQTGDGGSEGHRVFRAQPCHRLGIFEPEYSYLDSEACEIAGGRSAKMAAGNLCRRYTEPSGVAALALLSMTLYNRSAPIAASEGSSHSS